MDRRQSRRISLEMPPMVAIQLSAPFRLFELKPKLDHESRHLPTRVACGARLASP